jgi:hypothetical protein
MRAGLMVRKRAAKHGDMRWRRGVARTSVVAVALTLTLSLAVASVTLAAPKGIFTRFAQCSTGAPNIGLCEHAEITGGVFTIGKISMPISRTIVIQGGALKTGGSNFNEYFLSPATNGESISSNELVIPGGLQAILQCPQAGCRDPSGSLATNGVSATLETAASPGNPGIHTLAAALEERGAAFTIPIRLQLRNSLLGGACYLGSAAHPIELRLTSGATSPPAPNKPITGTLGQGSSTVENGYEVGSFVGGKLVDNAFSVPVAQGCGEKAAWLTDLEIDHTLGLESPAGHNTAILVSAFQIAEAEAVVASASFPDK